MCTKNLYLVIHPISFPYIKNVARYIWAILRKLNDVTPSMMITDRIDNHEYPSNSIILVIGDPFQRFFRTPDCYYIFINFSLLYNIRRRWFMPYSSRKWLYTKHKLFIKKITCYDMVIDYHPMQTSFLVEDLYKNNILIPVKHFPTNVFLDKKLDLIPIKETLYDICVVGSVSPRRKHLFDQLITSGYKLSPYNGDITNLISKSKLTLNIHMYDSDNMELPRIIEVAKLGRCLVTEECYGLDKVLPSGCYSSAKYSSLLDHVRHLLDHPETMQQMGQEAQSYINGTYSELCEIAWHRIIADPLLEPTSPL